MEKRAVEEAEEVGERRLKKGVEESGRVVYCRSALPGPLRRESWLFVLWLP